MTVALGAQSESPAALPRAASGSIDSPIVATFED
jgi:hypothetical protein